MGAATPLPREVDKQIREIIEKVKGGTMQSEDGMEAITLKLADRAELVEVRAAITQLEEDKAKLAKDVQEQLRRHRSLKQFDPTYRGQFGCSEHARQFGLYSMALLGKGAQKERALAALESECPELHALAMGTGTTDAGAAALLTELNTRIISMFEEGGVFERNAFGVTMGEAETSFVVETDGMEVYLVAEGVAPTGSDPGTKLITLTPKEWGALAYISRTLSEDAAIDVGEMIARQMARKFPLKMDKIGFVGDGTSTYFRHSGVTKKLTDVNGVDDGGGLVLGSGNAWSELLIGDFNKVMGALPMYAGSNPKWYCSRNFFFTVMAKIANSAGGVTAGEIEGKRRLLFGGDPVELVQVMPKTEGNSQVCCLYGDLSQAAVVGRRREFKIETSDQYKFAERQLTILGTRRVAVDVHSVGTATEAGPIVGLITAGA